MTSGMLKHTFSWAIDAQPSPSCRSRGQCITIFLRIIGPVFAQASEPGSHAFLLEIDSLKTADFDKLCKSCAQEARGRHDAGRQLMWDNLPSYFGLPPGEDLMKHDAK